MNAEYDVIVMGGGPAGSTAATLVADAGLKTLLVERERMPRFHVGESLMPETYWTLRRLGVLDRLRLEPFTRKVGVQFVDGDGKISQPFLFAEHDPRDCVQTWHVERAAFDKLLFERAAEAGAECHDCTRASHVRLSASPPHRVEIKKAGGPTSEVSARVVIDATGQQSLLANRLRLKSVDQQLRKAAIWGHFRGAKRKPAGAPELTTILHTKRQRAWFWYIPIGKRNVSVGLVSDHHRLLRDAGSPAEMFHREMKECEVLTDLMQEAQLVDTLHVAKEFSYSTRQRSGPGWVMVGDAFGFLDPIYSTGVFLALRSGELAADCVIDGVRSDDLSPARLGRWVHDFDVGVSRFRTLVNAFYRADFSFSEFLRKHPEHHSNLTDLLIGRAFTSAAASLVEDLERALRAPTPAA